jgi:hypothetical protein
VVVVHQFNHDNYVDMVLEVEPLSEAEDIHDVDKFKEDFVATNVQQTSPLMEPHIVAEYIHHDIEKLQEGIVVSCYHHH